MSRPRPRKISLIALDMDGTLLNDQKQISQRNAAALRLASQQGIHIMLASGRMSILLFPFEKELGFPCLLVPWNGAACIHKDTDTQGVRSRLFELPVPADVSDQLVLFAEDRGLHLNFYINDKLYAKYPTESNKKWGALYERRANIKINYVNSLEQFKGKAPTKMLFIQSTENIGKLETELRGLLAGRAHVTRSDPEYIEVLNPQTNKGEGVARACEALGVPLDEVVAFGDADNDAEMLAKVGYGIAVANANKNVKALAAHVSAWTNNEDAIGRELDILLKEQKCSL